MNTQLQLQTDHWGLHEFTSQVSTVVHRGGIEEGLCSLFVQHTSASLLIQENADPSARHDLENWLNRLVKEHDPLYTHTQEGADDMPAHIKTALTNSCLTIPIINHQLALGTWQGIFLWEHRHQGGRRSVIVHID